MNISDWLSNEMALLLYVLAALLLLKFIVNLVRLLRTKWYLRRYKRWHSSRDEKFLESKSQVVQLLRDAGVHDGRISVSQPVGYGHLQVTQASVLNNFPSLDSDMSTAAQRLMREAIGTYRARMWETFNPLYWTESLIYLPREVLGYLGVPAESVFVKALQLVWWVIATLLNLLLVLYRPELRAFMESWF
jgi:hypothetical protein